MNGGKRSRNYWRIAARIASGAILLAGLAAGSRWHRGAKAAGPSPLEKTLASSARVAHPQARLIRHEARSRRRENGLE
jgi:hypothetical protein